jgi:hypothetical protein
MMIIMMMMMMMMIGHFQSVEPRGTHWVKS